MPTGPDDQNSEMLKPATENSAVQRREPPVRDETLCPLCGGPVKRTWNNLPMMSFATFIIFLVAAPVLFFVGVPRGWTVLANLSLVCAGISLFSLWALPVTTAVAVVAQPRCRPCGHLYLLEHDEASATGPATFPWPSAVIGCVILLVILVVGLAWFRSAPGQETGIVGLTFLVLIVMAGLAWGLGLLAQAMTWRRVRLHTTSVARRPMLLLPVLVLSAGWLALTGYEHAALSRKYEPVKRSPVVLNRAGLAPLPTSARDVKVEACAFAMSGKYTLRFAADPNDIERFLAASPSVATVEPQAYSTERMRLRGGKYAGTFDKHDAQGNEYFAPQRDVPRWYQQEIRGSGRRYEVNWYDGKYQGELLIDDEEHIVCVHVDRY